MRCPHDGSELRVSNFEAPHAPHASHEVFSDAPFGTVDRSDPMIGRVLDGRFTLISKLGNGSMGTVYRARQRAIERDVAIKILRRDKALDEASKARFLREARANSALVSPHTVTAFDFGESTTGELFLAMELLEGESLGQRLSRVGRLPPERVVDTAVQALRSLAEAHAKGIVHRDLKPDNLFYAQVKQGDAHEEIVKVVDFGVAKMLGEGMGPINAIETQAGTVFGTPRYMSPEQAQAKPLDGRSDLYSLAVLMYHMLAGRPPFTDEEAVIVMARHIKTAPKPLRETCPEAGIPRRIEAVVMRCLAKNPNQRPASAEAMADELVAALEASQSLIPSPPTSGRLGRGSTPRLSQDASADDSLNLPGVSSTASAERRRRWRTWGVLATGAALVAVVAVGMFVRERAPSGGVAAPDRLDTAESENTTRSTNANVGSTGARREPIGVVPSDPRPASPTTTETAPSPVAGEPSQAGHTGPVAASSRAQGGVLKGAVQHHGRAAPSKSAAAAAASSAPKPATTTKYGTLE